MRQRCCSLRDVRAVRLLSREALITDDGEEKMTASDNLFLAHLYQMRETVRQLQQMLLKPEQLPTQPTIRPKAGRRHSRRYICRYNRRA